MVTVGSVLIIDQALLYLCAISMLHGLMRVMACNGWGPGRSNLEPMTTCPSFFRMNSSCRLFMEEVPSQCK